MLDWATQMTNQGLVLARLLIALAAVVSVGITFWQTKGALIPTASAAIVAGIAIWAVSPLGMSTLEGWIQKDTATGSISVTDLIDLTHVDLGALGPPAVALAYGQY
jgi:hypothetical protein